MKVGDQPMGINKTQQAFLCLNDLVKAITSDGKLTRHEIEELMDWRVEWRTVVKRSVLKPFTEWFDEAVADGRITRNEAAELLAWAEEIANHPEHEEIKSRRLVAAEKWRSHPVTEPQVQFLIDLGVAESESLKMTKGEASERIESILEAMPATENQIAFLKDFGYSDRDLVAISREQASDLISQRLSERDFTENLPPTRIRDHRGRFKAKESGCLLLMVYLIGIVVPMTAIPFGWSPHMANAGHEDSRRFPVVIKNPLQPIGDHREETVGVKYGSGGPPDTSAGCRRHKRPAPSVFNGSKNVPTRSRFPMRGQFPVIDEARRGFLSLRDAAV